MFLWLPKKINNSIQKTPENCFPLINVFAFNLKSSLKNTVFRKPRKELEGTQFKTDTQTKISAWKDFTGDYLTFLSFLMMQPKDKIELLYCCVRYDSLIARMKSCGKSVYVTGSRILVRVHFPKHARIKWCSNIFAFFLKHLYKFKTWVNENEGLV